jgi:peptidyl-prolyl cis-trans isomerase D
MLQEIRERVSGWLAYGIIFLISIPFALFGVNSYFGGGEAPPAATVNGEEITLRDFDQAYANYRQRVARLFGGSIPESFSNETAMRQQVLSQLVEELAVRQYTDERRYRIGDEDLGRIIHGMQVFHRDGQFDAEVYQAQLRSIGASPLGFEQELRQSQATNQFQNGIQATAFMVPVQESRFANLNNQSRKIRSLGYSVDPGTITVDEQEIEERYRLTPDRFRTPEQIKIEYIEINLDNIKQGISIDRENSHARYQENIDAYSSPEVRDASHILIKVSDDQENEQALAQITKISERISNGESFSDLASELSQDSGSAADGGSLGEVERGIMVQAFEESLFALQPGQVSDPVKTNFGWHVIQLHSVSGGETQSFESVRTEIEDEIRNGIAEGQIFELVETLSNLVYEQSDSLLAAAEQLDLKIETSDWFERSVGEGIAAEQKIRQVAYSADVYQLGLNSEAIELGEESVVFIRLKEIKKSEVQPLEQVSDQIREELIRGKTQEQNLAVGSSALEALKQSKNLEQLAEDWSSSIVDHGFVTRDQTEVDDLIKRTVFRMPKPDQGMKYEGVSLTNGSYNIVELSAVISNDSNTDNDTLESTNSANAGADYQSIVKMLGSRADVVKTPLEDLDYPNQL